jgi:hypothetical protein
MALNDTERSPGDVGLRLTYAEIAERLGISGDAARQLVRRRGWRRIVPNRRGATTTVIVPEDDIAGEQRRDPRSADDGDTTPDGNRLELRLALTTVDRLSQQLAEANVKIDQAERWADQAVERADQAMTRADRAETRADAANAAAQEAAQAAEALRRADDARKARGLVARLRAAWRGE